MVDEQEWFVSVFRRLDKKREKKKLAWANPLPWMESGEFMGLAEKYIPCVLDMIDAIDLRYFNDSIDIFSHKSYWR